METRRIFRWPLLAARLLLILAIVVLVGLAIQPAVGAAMPAGPRHFTFIAQAVAPSARQQSIPVEVYIPKGVSAETRSTVLVALHGVGANGADFASPLVSQAEARGWVVVSPTFVYDSWLDVPDITDDDMKAIAAVRMIVAQLPSETGLRFNSRVLLYGFSRGAQVAHRYALLHPDEVLGVAALSAGAYTLPTAYLPPADVKPLDWPLGVADISTYSGHAFQPDLLRRVHFFVGVGTKDTQERDVPRAWDACSGTNRVARATAFAEDLQKIGVPVHYVQVPNVGHRETPEMVQAAIDYLASVVAGSAS